MAQLMNSRVATRKVDPPKIFIFTISKKCLMSFMIMFLTWRISLEPLCGFITIVGEYVPMNLVSAWVINTVQENAFDVVVGIISAQT